jgi:hypothetical protein
MAMVVELCGLIVLNSLIVAHFAVGHLINYGSSAGKGTVSQYSIRSIDIRY